MKALLRETILAESDNTVVIEGNHYFPASSLKKKFLIESKTTSVCPWKGDANYFSVVVDGKEYTDVAWTYKNPKPEATQIKDHIAFWKDVEVVD